MDVRLKTSKNFKKCLNRTATHALTFLHITSRKQKNGFFMLKCRKQENISRNFVIMRMEKEIALLW